MIIQRNNCLQFFIAILIGVVIQDLKFDFSEDIKYSSSYYEGQWSKYNPIIDILVVLLGVSLIYEVIKNRNWKNFVAFGLILLCGFSFAVILIPLQQSLGVEKLKDELKQQMDFLETIKFQHIYILIALLVALLFTVLGSVPTDQEKIQGKNKGKIYYQFSLTALYVCYILGIMLIDLKNDMIPDFKFVKNYYTAQFYSNSIAQFMIIGLGFTLLREVVQVQNKNKIHYLVLIMIAISGYVFAYQIQPQMKKFNLSNINNDEMLRESAEEIKFYHVLLIFLLFICLVLLQQSGREGQQQIQEQTKVSEEKNKKKQKEKKKQ